MINDSVSIADFVFIAGVGKGDGGGGGGGLRSLYVRFLCPASS